MTGDVREPIQVYLTESERADLDRLAGSLGVSRSETLRRGVSALKDAGSGDSPLMDLVAEGVVTPARRGPAPPPIAQPVAPLNEILDELNIDREDR